jgi:hypothetical protein
MWGLVNGGTCTKFINSVHFQKDFAALICLLQDTCKTVSFIFPLTNDGGNSNFKHWFGLCCDGDIWMKFDVARIIVSYDNHATLWILIDPLLHDNTQVDSTCVQSLPWISW